MDKKIIHEVKLPRVITVALYAIGLLANVFKPVVMGHPAFAELNEYDTIKVSIENWSKRVPVAILGTVGTCNMC